MNLNYCSICGTGSSNNSHKPQDKCDNNSWNSCCKSKAIPNSVFMSGVLFSTLIEEIAYSSHRYVVATILSHNFPLCNFLFKLSMPL